MPNFTEIEEKLTSLGLLTDLYVGKGFRDLLDYHQERSTELPLTLKQHEAIEPKIPLRKIWNISILFYKDPKLSGKYKKATQDGLRLFIKVSRPSMFLETDRVSYNFKKLWKFLVSLREPYKANELSEISERIYFSRGFQAENEQQLPTKALNDIADYLISPEKESIKNFIIRIKDDLNPDKEDTLAMRW